MFYLKNLPVWERWLRLGLGGAVAIYGLQGIDAALGWGLVVAGAGIALTGVLGFCPACAMVGRQLDKNARPGGAR